ncbi:unnamed protein product [Arabidopsis halleri]
MGYCKSSWATLATPILIFSKPLLKRKSTKLRKYKIVKKKKKKTTDLK